MLSTILVSATVALGFVVEKPDGPFSDAEYWQLWQRFQNLDDTTPYATFDEHNKRFEIFKENMDLAREFNADNDGTRTYKLGITKFADQTEEEFADFLKLSSGVKPKLGMSPTVYNAQAYPAPKDSVDWVSAGAVTPVKAQGKCNSCWSFSATGALEGQNFLVNGKLVSLSEQELVDCTTQNGNCMGEPKTDSLGEPICCPGGGDMDLAFDWVSQNGICLESAYPYAVEPDTVEPATNGSDCKMSSCTSRVSITGFTDIKSKSVADLKSAVSNVGPISIAVDANNWSRLYVSGIFNDCSTSLDHGVLLVGYGTESGESYWKVKNSWGPSWGEHGYIRLANDDADTCGLAEVASFPVVGKARSQFTLE